MRPVHRIACTLMLAFIAVLCMAAAAIAVDVNLIWQDPNNNPADLEGYRVYYWQAAWDMPAVIEAGLNLFATVGDLDHNQTYSFAATAYAPDGRESVFSNVITLRVRKTPPGKDKNQRAGTR